MKHRRLSKGMFLAGLALSAIVGASPAGDAFAAITCERDVQADVVVIDQPLMFNRLGAGNPNATIYALRRDVIFSDTQLPLTVGGRTPAPTTQGELYELRPDRRPRPLVLRVRVGDCLTVSLQNLLKPAANPRQNVAPVPGALATAAGQLFTVPLDEQPLNRVVSFHAAGMQLVSSIDDDGSMVGRNNLGLAGSQGAVDNVNGSLAVVGQTKTYKLYAEKEGVFLVTSEAVLIGSDANEGHVANGLFGQVIVEPKGSAIYRSQVLEEEIRLTTTGYTPPILGSDGTTPIPGSGGQPVLDYEALYPGVEPWISEGKAGLPVLNMIQYTGGAGADGPIVHIVHSEINAVVAYGPGGVIDAASKGHYPSDTYPLESVGKRNPALPNRLEPFRDFASLFHDETANGQAFPGFFVADPVYRYVLAGVKDAFMINYGSGGIGSEIIANRLGVGPMHDCLDCAYEEFFLTSFTVGDPAMLVDVPANLGLEACGPALGAPCAAVGRKANYAIGAEDPSNVHHSYTGDFTKFRNTHAGKEQHVFHLHNHQWLYNPNDDNSNYLDAQGIGPGSGYTYEINNGGSGNRNKSSGDAIFHCHFYPHFAQGMWYHWRHNDTFQTGTILAATPGIVRDGDGIASVPLDPNNFHTTPWALADTTPATGARAYPDGEIVTGTPIPAVVPLPGKPMPVMPGRATVVAKVVTNPSTGITSTVGSNAKIIDRNIHPGFPFWVAGIEDIVGQRPTTPPLDMLDSALATDLRDGICVDGAGSRVGNPVNGSCVAFPGTSLLQDPLYQKIDPKQADGWDGGLPRHALEGVAAGGTVAANQIGPKDFSKKIGSAMAVYYPEEGTDLERVAMAFHQLTKYHPTYLPDGTLAVGSDPHAPGVVLGFRTNGGGGPVVGAPFHNPCVDDWGNVLDNNVVGKFFGGSALDDVLTTGSSVFTSDNPRIYKGTFLQFDAVLNKVGYHYPQERIVALWQDVGPIIAKNKAPEPMVFRFNTFDCMVYHNSNLVPENYEMDDYQVRTPTDIIGQHIHLPKWDLTTTDGAANGWNYEDGTLSPGTVQERIEAIRVFNACLPADPRNGTGDCPEALPHPYFDNVARALGGGFPAHWMGARTTIQRWFADPVVNVARVDRGLGIIFTHDHYGPSTHQQIGLYSTALAEPAGSLWLHNETGTQLACTAPTARPTTTPAGTIAVNNLPCRWDGGPTSWQAQIRPPAAAPGGSNVLSETIQPYREFYFEFSDFQHAYEAGVYVGAGQDGLPLAGTGAGAGPVVRNTGNTLFNNNPADAFRFAINPPARFQLAQPFPELVLEAKDCVLDPANPLNVLLARPCPQAIDVQDPGILVVNYRHEPVGLRIYDPNKLGPDGKRGMQADGERGDLAFALQSRTDRVIPQMNVQPTAATVINGTRFPPPINTAVVAPGDPFTPMMRTYAGDVVRVKLQAGGHEEEHNATIFGMKWLNTGSGHGRGPNSGWRNAQASGISEQFTLAIPVVPTKTTGSLDYGYSMDASHDGWWSGMWGIMRAHNTAQANLSPLPSSAVPIKIANQAAFISGTTCPLMGPDGITPTPRRNYDITAVLANTALANNVGAFIPTPLNTVAGTPAGDVARQHVGGPLNAAGGTLVYNNRNTTVGGQTIVDPAGNIVLPAHEGPLHDPTSILYVRTADLDAAGKLRPGVPVEPLVLRAAAGECISVTLRNRLPALGKVANRNVSTAPDLATYSTIQGVVKRDRFAPLGATRFDTNLFRPSSWVGISPQLLAFDVEKDGGVVVGANSAGQAAIQPGANKTFNWYAGDLSAMQVAGKQFQLFATPVELGGASLLPADKVKQGAKSLVGAVVIEPVGATWPGSAANLNRADASDVAFLDNTYDHQQAPSLNAARRTRAQTTVTAKNPLDINRTVSFRDFSLVLTKAVTQYYKDGTPVEHMNGEADGIPEDSQEASGMSLNYGIEPLWFRFGLVPQAPFGNALTGAGAYGSVPNAHQAFSNVLLDNVVNGNPVGDPVTPVFVANMNQEARLRITNPYSSSRGSTFGLHGHVWQRDPYVCNDIDAVLLATLPGKCTVPATGSFIDPVLNRPLVGSQSIGHNPLGFATSGQESWTASSHFDIVLPSAGGGNGVAGDYLFRDKASFGNASGVWGILRVQ